MKALITGITGQDGAYLARLLVEKGWDVVGAERRTASGGHWRLEELGVEHDVEFQEMDLLDSGSVERVVRNHEPDHVYNLAAQTFVGASFDVPSYTMQANAMGALRLLEAVRQYVPEARYYQASTSEMYGGVSAPQDELTPFTPRSPYGIAKLAAHWLTVNYRESYGLHASTGILFNHESPLRGPEFVTRKIAAGVARYATTRLPFTLGNLDARRDWGYAPEYVEGMHAMLQQPQPGDYVLATGRTTTVRAFATLCFQSQGLEVEWRGEGAAEIGFVDDDIAVQVDSRHYRPAEVWTLQGNASKAHERLGWRARVQVEELAGLMTEAEVARLGQRIVEVA